VPPKYGKSSSATERSWAVFWVHWRVSSYFDRSVRTLQLRVVAQSNTAAALTKWLDVLSHIPAGQEWDGACGGLIEKVTHSSLQMEEFVKKQHYGGHPPCIGAMMKTGEYAKKLQFRLRLFTYATSLGGVESLVEQRRMTNREADVRAIRFTIGLEDVEDLKNDFRQALKTISQEEKEGKVEERSI